MSKKNSNPPEKNYSNQFLECQFYQEDEDSKNSKFSFIQYSLAQRAYDLLELPEDGSKLILDIGCGTGLSGNVLGLKKHNWIGVDISGAMLELAKHKQHIKCIHPELSDFVHLDIGTGLPFRKEMFDGAISISTIQWLCLRDKTQIGLQRFFKSLFACLSRSARAVLQFDPENDFQTKIICSEAVHAGFKLRLMIDKSSVEKHHYLVLSINGFPKLSTSFDLHRKRSTSEFNSSFTNRRIFSQRSPTTGLSYNTLLLLYSSAFSTSGVPPALMQKCNHILNARSDVQNLPMETSLLLHQIAKKSKNKKVKFEEYDTYYCW